jgi:CP family cyanate transporter-like MFS transporter
VEDHAGVTRTAAMPAAPTARDHRRGLLLIGVAIELTGLNLRTAVNSVGPVLQEIETGLDLSSGLAGLVTSMPVLCFAAIGFAGPPLAARYRDGHVLAGSLLTMAAGLLLRSAAGSIWLFLVGTILAMGGGALGNVLLPSLVKRHFPHRTGLLVGAYTGAMATGGAVASVSAAPIAAAAGAEGWRWGLGVWAVTALVGALPWLLVPSRPGTRTARKVRVPMRSLRHSPLAIALAVFFGILGLESYVIIGWTAQYLRDSGMSAADAGLMLGVATLVVIPVNLGVPGLVVRPRWQRPMLVAFVCCYVVGWGGLALAPLAVTWVWMLALGMSMGSFAMVLTLIGLRARTAESTAALSTVVQGSGYVLAAVGPLLVGVLRGITGGYTGMFLLVFIGVAVLALSGWLVTRPRYVDDEVNRKVAGWSSTAHCDDVLEVAGAEAPVSVHVTQADGGSPRD